MKLKIPYIEVEQPIGTFYLSAINAKDLVDIVDIRRRGSENNYMFLFDSHFCHDSSFLHWKLYEKADPKSICSFDRLS